MRVELLDPDAPRWQETVALARHDFYHLPSYVRLSATYDGGEPRAVYAEDGAFRLLLPLIVRPAGRGMLDGTSPYGYPGPLVSGPRTFARSAWGAVRERLRAAGLVSLFVRLHPLLDADPPEDAGVVVEHGETVSVDLALSTEELWRQTMSGHRNEINRALRAGHRAYIDERWEHLPTFGRLYRATMERLGAGAYYRFPDRYFEQLRDALGHRLRLSVVDIGGTIAAAGLFVETAGIVQYHLSGSDEAFTRERPIKLLLQFVRAWAKERGNLRMHLGGGVGGKQDSLFRFKAGFSHSRHPFRTLRVVLDEAAYAELVHSHDPTLDPTRLDGFFPLYRRPTATEDA
jgi:GNAT acetyltransferase-like protein